MAGTNWQTEIGKIKPYIFKIYTPTVTGTGFQIFRNKTGMCGIATAYHVVGHAYEWEEPIKVTHYESNKTKILKADSNQRAIYAYPDKDLAFIIFQNSDLPLKEETPKLIEAQKLLDQGSEIGWSGFPVVSPNDLCFFAGHISCYLPNIQSYLVDGVAINGVSGAPAFFIDSKSSELKICGVISNYFPNRATGEVLPGLSMIRSVETYQETLKNLKSVDEASEKAKEQQLKTQTEIPKK